MSVFLFIIVIVGLVTCGEVLSKALDQRAARPAIDPGREAEVGQLREQVESLATEVARLTEEQRFMTRLLAFHLRRPGMFEWHPQARALARQPAARPRLPLLAGLRLMQHSEFPPPSRRP